MTDQKRFCDMTPEEQGAIALAIYQGKRVEWYCGSGWRNWPDPTPPDKDDSILVRIAPTKPSINWDHVSPEYNWLAVDKCDWGYLYQLKPNQQDTFWDDGNDAEFTKSHASYTRGDYDWRDSLVQRPGAND